jgi:hypothetical protein
MVRTQNRLQVSSGGTMPSPFYILYFSQTVHLFLDTSPIHVKMFDSDSDLESRESTMFG